MAPHDHTRTHPQTRTNTKNTTTHTQKHTHITDISQIMYIETKRCYRPTIPAPRPTPASPASQSASQPASVFSRVENTFFHRPQFETDIMFLTALRKLDFAHISTSLAHSRGQAAICSLASRPSSSLVDFWSKRVKYVNVHHSSPVLLPALSESIKSTKQMQINEHSQVNQKRWNTTGIIGCMETMENKRNASSKQWNN